MACIGLKCFGALIRSLPLAVSVRLGALLGELLFLFDPKHRARAYANIRKAFRDDVTPPQARQITKAFYRSFGQNLMDVLLLPVLNEARLKEYVTVEGLEHVRHALEKGKGVILLGMHAGSWELSNALTANLWFVFHLFVRDQRDPRLDTLLRSYRTRGTSRIIRRASGARALIGALKRNEAIGMTLDQGGRYGRLVDFFGAPASMATGAVKLALRYGAAIIPGYYTRLNTTQQKVILQQAFPLARSGDEERDIAANLSELTRIFEAFIRKYPSDYLWTYKIWKYSDERELLILDDGRTGHLRQSQAVAEIITALLAEKGIRTKVRTIAVRFNGPLARRLFQAAASCAGRYQCQGCLACQKLFLERSAYDALSRAVADIVISCGSSTAAVNFLIARQSEAASIAVLKPSTLSLRRFNAVIMPRHDRPPRRRNVIMTDGALNLISERALREHGEALLKKAAVKIKPAAVRIGLLIGGDTKQYSFSEGLASSVIGQVKQASEKLDADIFVTTSRRTSRAVEGQVKAQLGTYSRCRFAVIANEVNVAFAVEGILGVSTVVVVSPESISMVSEAASSGAAVVVVDGRLDARHRRFLDTLAGKGYITLSRPEGIASTIAQLASSKGSHPVLDDRRVAMEALGRIL